MATTIAKLNVMLTASAKGLTTELVKARTKVQAFSAGVNKMGNAVQNKITSKFKAMGGTLGIARLGFQKVAQTLTTIGVAATAAATGLAYFVAKTGAAVDENAKLARRLGLTYNEFKAMQIATGLAGITVDQFSVAFEKMLDTLGAARMGNASAIAAFEQIGISIQSLNGMSPAEVFNRIGDAINGIPNPADKITAIRDLFGRGGAPMLELFAGGAEGIAYATDKLHRFGLALTSLETDKIEFMNDRFSELLLILEGVGSQLSVHIAPYISQAALDTQTWVDNMNGVNGIVDGAMANLVDLLDRAAMKFDRLIVAGEKVMEVLTTISKINPFRKTTEFFEKVVDTDMGEAVKQRRDTRVSFSDRYRLFKGRAQRNDAARGRESLSGLDAEARAALEEEQRQVNAGPISAAIANRQAEQDAMFNATIGKQMYEANLKQQRMAEQAAKHPSWFRMRPSVPQQASPKKTYLFEGDDYYKTKKLGASSYKDKIPDGAPGYLDKIPTGDPAYLEKMPGANRANPQQSDMEQTALLRQIAMNTGRGNIAYAG